MQHKLISSPLQGFTTFPFRNAQQHFFGGIDTFYAPYIRLNGKFKIKPLYERDIALKNNRTLNVIPQIMTNSAEEFVFVAKYVQSLGYNELNWNLGCPYPMVTNKGMGSGLICQGERIDEILDQVHSETDIIVSMKMRMGYAHSGEILDTFPILEKYPIKNIGIHARIGAQLYRGGVDLEGFERCVNATSHELWYNGDITTVEGFRAMTERFPTIRHWMLGRGLIADPFLPQMIKNDTTEYPDDRKEVFSKYHDTLCSHFQEKLSGDKHVIMKMLSYWEYFAETFDNPTKVVKQIKKTKTLDAYDDAVMGIMDELESYQY